MFTSLIFRDSPGFCSISIASSSHGVTILHSGKFHIFFFRLLFKPQIKNWTSPSCSAWKTTFRKALFSNKCVNFIKNYENKHHLLRQNGITSCFFSNLNCFPLIIDILNQKSNTTIIFSGKNYPRITGFHKIRRFLQKKYIAPSIDTVDVIMGMG